MHPAWGAGSSLRLGRREATTTTGPPVELSYMDVDDDSVPGIVSVCRDFAKHRREWAEVPLDMDADNEIPREEYHEAYG